MPTVSRLRLLALNDANFKRNASLPSPRPAKSKLRPGAADWLASEARYLRKIASMMDTAAGRLNVVLQRCGSSEPATSSLPPSSP